MDVSLPDPELLLGRLAIHYQLLTKEQVAEAIQRRRESQSPFDLGTFLVMEEYLTVDQLQKLHLARDRYLAKKGAAGAAPGRTDPGDETLPVGADGTKSPADKDDTVPVLEISNTGSAEPAVAQPAAATEPSMLPGEDMPSLDSMGNGNAVADITGQTHSAPPAAAPAGDVGTEAATSVAAPAAPPATASADSDGLLQFGPEESLHSLLRQSIELGASDLHIHSGAPLRFRMHGRLVVAHPRELDRETARRLVLEGVPDAHHERLQTGSQVDWALSLESVGRFRANAYRQQRGFDAVFRAIPLEPPSLEGLGLPASLEQFTQHHQGMVLLTGPAGCGKSSTMAALVNLINEHRPEHVITIEDPIEYVHESRTAVVNQRQIGDHTESFARALRAALREDPDVIVIGELRDLETIQLALTAAETGHLVLGTLHTSGAIRTLHRLLGVFPPEQQAQIRTMVSESLRAIVSQRLVRRRSGDGRMPALEILINTKAAGNLIRDNKTFQIQSVMQTGTELGMCLLDGSLAELVRRGQITKEEAIQHAEDPKRFA